MGGGGGGGGGSYMYMWVSFTHLCFLVNYSTVFMVISRQDNVCGNECTFQQLHVYLQVSKVTHNSTKMASLKIAHSVPISVLASEYLVV